ncbi:hypothetical protein ACFLY3_04100 [Chloroflexota bacterium]
MITIPGTIRANCRVQFEQLCKSGFIIVRDVAYLVTAKVELSQVG